MVLGGLVLLVFERRLVDHVMQKKGLTNGTRFWLGTIVAVICWAYVAMMCVAISYSWAFLYRRISPYSSFEGEWLVPMYAFALLGVWFKFWYSVIAYGSIRKCRNIVERSGLILNYTVGLGFTFCLGVILIACLGPLCVTLLMVELISIVQILLIRKCIQAIGTWIERGDSCGIWESVILGFLMVLCMYPAGKFLSWPFILMRFFEVVWVFMVCATIWLRKAIRAELKCIEDFKVDLTKKYSVHLLPSCTVDPSAEQTAGQDENKV